LYYVVVLFLYLLYLMYLGSRTKQALRRIVAKSKSTFNLITIQRKWKDFERNRNLLIPLQELTLYEERLQLKIFSLLNLDFAFIFQMALTFAAYIVILIQTRT